MMSDGTIRPLALAIITHDDKIFVGDGYDPTKETSFYRALGGGIEFGETAEQTLHREFAEELDIEIEDLQYLKTVENIFTFNGKKGHEIVLIYKANLKNTEIYQKNGIPILDSKAGHKAFWIEIEDFKNKSKILYPEAILDLL